MNNIDIPDLFKNYRLIPLTKDTKIARVKWGNDDELEFNGTETGYGIDTGRSNLLVVDCDTKGDVNGINNFIALCAENGGIPDTLTVETPNNGIHFYFINKNKKINSFASTVFGEGIDVRANGGYVVGPGSQIKDNAGDLKKYSIEDEDCSIQELPKWMEDKIIDYIKNTKTNDATKNSANKNIKKSKTDAFNPHEEEEQNNALVWAIDKMTSSKEGTRNTTLNSVSYFMGCKRVSRDEAKKLMDIAIKNGLDKDEAEKTFNSGYDDGLAQEKISYSIMVKEYNIKNGITFKDDPKDTEYYSHVALSYNFWKKYNSQLLYLEDTSWYRYSNKKGVWEITSKQIVKTLIKDYCEELVLRIREENPRLPINVYRAQEKIWLKNTIEAVEGVAELDFIVKADEQKFDDDPYLINCKNGVYNVKTDDLLEHDKKYFLTKFIPVDFIRGAKDKYTDMIINGIAKDERDYMKYTVGQALVGEQPNIHSLFFLYGRGSNGKSTFIDLLTKTSGTYGRLQSPDILLPTNGKEVYALTDFEGIRQAIVEELPDSKQLNSGSMKRLVGTDVINARPIYGKNKTFENKASIFVSCNRLPVVTENDNGTWRRLTVFTFPYSYKMTKAEVKNSNDKLGDPMVLHKARKSAKTAEAFLAWRLEGAREVYLNPALELVKPDSILKTVKEWNENNDLIYGWANEKLAYKKDSIILVTELLDSLNDYLTSRGHARVSMRFLVEQFSTNKFFIDNKISYKRASRILNQYSVSSKNMNVELPTKPSFIVHAEWA